MSFTKELLMHACRPPGRRGRPFFTAVTQLLALLAAAFAGCAAWAQDEQAPAPTAEPPTISALDAPLFYQLLIGEMELRSGEPGNAFQVLLDAARRTRDEALFRRAVDIALQGRAGEQALAATRDWRSAQPASLEALRVQIQLLMALNRGTEMAEPLRTLLAQTPMLERPGVIASLPRLFQRAADKRQAATLLEQLLQPYLADTATRTAARVALGRAWLIAGDIPRALDLAEHAQTDDPGAPGPALLALELLPGSPAAEAIVAKHLAQPKPEPMVRLAYVRLLGGGQRYAEAVDQLQQLTREQPDLPQPWLTLGALQLELRQTADAELSLKRYLQLRETTPDAPGGDDADEDDNAEEGDDNGLVQARLLLAQAAEQRNDFKASEAWLAQVDSPRRALEVQARRALLLARQGKVAEARELLRRVPEREPADARAKLLAEAQVLRDVKQWREAHAVLVGANTRFPGDADLLYEQAMMAEKLERIEEMERLLRQVIETKPDHHHAYNALGYSLADRNQRLPEARQLIAKALELSPGDPFITDSLGWVEYRLGNREQALQLLRKAYASRPDTEIAAHLGEVLWSAGERDDALKVWRDARTRDAANEVLRETLARLKVDL
jgi:tetratricopeptide (TPR) repeat protein